MNPRGDSPRRARTAEGGRSSIRAPRLKSRSCLHFWGLTLRLMRTEHCRGAGVLERWQNGIALASKASARKGLGVRAEGPGGLGYTPVSTTETTEDPEGTGGQSLALRSC